MFNKESIEALQEGTSIVEMAAAVHAAFNDHGIVTVPDKYTLKDLEKFMPARRRQRGTMNTNSITDFAAYTVEHKELGCTVFVNPENMAARAVLNLGTKNLPGHCDNSAVVTLEKTAAFLALLSHTAQHVSLKQSQMAEFLEDWSDEIVCYNADVQPESQYIPIHKAIAAVRKLTIESMHKLESEAKSLSASKSTFESVAATSTETIPTMFRFETVPYHGLEVRTFEVRLGINTGGPVPTIGLRIIKMEEHDEQMAKEFAQLVRDALTGEERLPVLIGSYTTQEKN